MHFRKQRGCKEREESRRKLGDKVKDRGLLRLREGERKEDGRKRERKREKYVDKSELSSSII